MPKLTKRVPSYRRHKVSGHAVVTLGGKDFYLGPYGSEESRARYNQLVAEWLANARQSTGESVVVCGNLTINEMIIVYWEHAQSYYVKNGRPTGEIDNLRDAIRPLATLYGETRASQFGPLALEAVRTEMIKKGLCRTVINSRVNRIRRIFRWGVRKQMVDAAILQGLQSLEPLKRGRCQVRESSGVKPVPDEIVERTIAHAPPQVAVMIQLQRLTGMRPGEVTIMQSCDLDTSGNLWVYKPESHKTEHHGKERLIYLGPKAQLAMHPFLKNGLEAYLFSPREVVDQIHRDRRGHRVTPLTPSQRQRKRKSKPRKSPGDRYNTQSYGFAIRRACDKAFPHPSIDSTRPSRLSLSQRETLKVGNVHTIGRRISYGTMRQRT